MAGEDQIAYLISGVMGDRLSRIKNTPFQPVPADMVNEICTAVETTVETAGTARVMISGIPDQCVHNAAVEQISRAVVARGLQETRQHGFGFSATLPRDDVGFFGSVQQILRRFTTRSGSTPAVSLNYTKLGTYLLFGIGFELLLSSDTLYLGLSRLLQPDAGGEFNDGFKTFTLS